VGRLDIWWSSVSTISLFFFYYIKLAVLFVATAIKIGKIKGTVVGGVGVDGVEVEDAVWKTTTIVVEGLIMAAKIVIIEGVEVVEVVPVDTRKIMDGVGDRAAIAIDTKVLVGAMVDLHPPDIAEDRQVILQPQPLWLQSVFSQLFMLIPYLPLLFLASG
jgi:hypothetical protein